MAGGRPLKFKTNKALQNAVNMYFLTIDQWNDENEGKKPYTVAGLALHLDVDTETVRNYEKRDEFFGTIKKAKQKIEEQLETKLHGNSVTGIIFNLKNNYGWKDRTETDLTSKGEKINFIIPNDVANKYTNTNGSTE